MKRILITGGSSYLGRHLVPAALRQADICYTFFQHDPLGLPQGRQLDLRHHSAVRRLVADWRPDVIIHTAGSNRSPDMKAVICDGARHVRDAAAAAGARLIHISSDVVFDGQHAPYHESDPPNPTHDYGEAKAVAEEIIAGYPDHVIVRTSLIYGLEIMDRSTEWIVGALQAGQPVTLFDDQLRNPVWTETLCQSCLELAGLPYRGILHVAGSQAMSRAAFSLKLLDWWEVDSRDTLHIGPSSGSWPVDCRMDLSLARRILDTPLPGVDEVLQAARRTTE